MGFRTFLSARSDRQQSNRRTQRAYRGGNIETLERRSLLSVTLNSSADADVQNMSLDASLATANFGADPSLRVRTTATETFESYVTFDITELTGAASAVVKLTGGQGAPTRTPVTIGAFRTAGTFVEGNGLHSGIPDTGNDPAGEINFNNRPAVTGEALDTALIYGQGEYFLNVTQYVQEAKAAGQTSVTIAIRHVSGGGQQLTFESREGDTGAGPKLTVEENIAGPNAAIAVTDVAVPDAPTHEIVVAYSDEDDIDVATIDAADIEVLSVTGAPLDVVGVTPDATNPKSVVVTYTVAAPDGTWGANDGPAYIVQLREGEVLDVAGNLAAGGPETFRVAIGDVSTPTPTTPVPPGEDDVKPQAAITTVPPDVTTNGGTGTTVGVQFTDNVGLNASSVNPGTLVITRREDGTVLDVLDVDVDTAADAKTANALFNVAAPGGSWDITDNGTYDIRVVPSAVFDASGNVSDEVTATFVVNINPSAPPTPGTDVTPPTTAVVPLESIVEVGVTSSQQIRVTYVDDFGIDPATIDIANIVVAGPNGVPLTVTGVTTSPSADGKSVIATYTFTVPTGSWDSTDNGTYTVTLPAGAVTDTSANPSTATAGSFIVNVPPPKPDVDPSFGGGNQVSTGFVAEAAVAQADGKIIVAGRQGDLDAGTSQFVIKRLNADGTPDATFGTNGQVTGVAGANEAAFAIVLDAEGNILVAGRRGTDFLVMRFKSTGVADGKFGDAGAAVADFGGNDSAISLAIAPDGSIVAAGGSTDGAGLQSFAFAKFLSNGSADTTFGTGGRSLFAQGAGGNIASSVAVDSTGRVVAAGPAEGGVVAVVRLTATGAQDTTFGTNGVVTIAQLATRGDLGRPDNSIGVATLPDGSVLVASRTAGGDFAVAKLTPAGVLDTTFGGGTGVAVIDFGGDDDADAILVQGSGEILVLGTTTAGGEQLAVAALAEDGSLIEDFGTGGKLTIEATPTDTARALRVGDLVLRAFGSVTSDGRLVVGASDQRPAAVTSSPLRRLNVPGSGSVGLFGQVSGVKKAKKLTFQDADGTIVTVSMKGKGTGQVFSNGSSIDLVLTGVNASTLVISAKGGADGRVTLRNVQSDGALKGVTGKTTDVSGTFYVGGTLGKMNIGTLTGTLAASGAISSLVFGGDVKGQVLSGANYGVNGKAGGTGSAADTFGQGSIGKVSVAGTVVGATFAAGVNPVDSVLLDGNDQLVGGAASSIGNVTVKRGADDATRFVAGAFASKAKLPQAVTPATDPRFVALQ